MRYILPFLFAFVALQAQVDLRYQQNQTLTYNEVIQAYQYLADRFEEAKLIEYGPTDSGKPLHVFLIAKEQKESIGATINDKAVVLINNGIHPGESCGIDASIAFAQDLLSNGVSDGVVYAIIPIYNVGGSLNRGCCSRANQMGPEMHGFRGNARNLDLNRDFIKADALNTNSFMAIFHQYKPHIFIDTHTSNGADYQYTISLISTQKDKLNPVLADYMSQKMEPYLYKQMKKKEWEMIPYVNVFGRTPEAGYAAFLETPRYASGYTALFNTIGFITETHMLKPYSDRVESTRAFLHTINQFAARNAGEIIKVKKIAEEQDKSTFEFAINWNLDSTKYKKLEFKGYEASYPISEVTGLEQLKYNREKEKTFQIKYYDTFKASKKAIVPKYYVVPKAWREVPFLMQYNGVEMIPLLNDTAIEVTSYYASQFEFPKTPYEGHFLIKDLKVESRVQIRTFFKGDYLVPTNQKHKRFIVNVLEPTAVDSYLRWNFYDEIFQQKEWFSDYVYDQTALEILKEDPQLYQNFEEWKLENPNTSAFARLYYIYKNSKNYEEEHLRYPVARIE